MGRASRFLRSSLVMGPTQSHQPKNEGRRNSVRRAMRRPWRLGPSAAGCGFSCWRLHTGIEMCARTRVAFGLNLALAVAPDRFAGACTRQ